VGHTAPALLTLLLALAACSSEAINRGGPPGGSEPPPTPAEQEPVSLVSLYEPSSGWSATALAFDPLRPGDLWVTLRQPLSDLPCTMDDGAGCSDLIGQVALVHDATANPDTTIEEDGNAWHFMRRPTAIAFGDNGNLATCGEANTDNYLDDSTDFAGPVLWSSDPTIFGAAPKKGQNGTHIDMLHESPFCMGIAHERDNVYWAFNGQLGALDRYDFHGPHVVGGEDHSDGEFWRYAEGQLSRTPEVPSHMALDRQSGMLYVADTGNQRVIRLVTGSGTLGEDVPTLDPIAVHRRVDGAIVEEVVGPGVLQAPAGLAIVGDELVVADHARGILFWFDLDGRVLKEVETNLRGIGGVAVGPDGKIYVSDLETGGAFRVELQ
jgi:hypothetical protein